MGDEGMKDLVSSLRDDSVRVDSRRSLLDEEALEIAHSIVDQNTVSDGRVFYDDSEEIIIISLDKHRLSTSTARVPDRVDVDTIVATVSGATHFRMEREDAPDLSVAVSVRGDDDE